MATTGQSSSGAYAVSFGAMPDRTTYSSFDVNTKSYSFDHRQNIFGKGNIGLKALTTTSGGAGTAGYATIPVYVDPAIVDQTRKYTPLCEIFPRVTNYGTTADYNIITAKGGGYVRGEDAALAETNTTYDRASKAIKYLYAVGRVTGPAQAAIPPYALPGFVPGTGQAQVSPFNAEYARSATQIEVLVKAREIKELEENLLINGDSSSNANEFDGFIAQISTTNKLDKNTSALSLDDINTAIQYAFDDGGRPNLAVCSSAVFTDLLNLLTARIGYLQATKSVLWGFETIVLHTMVGPVTVIPSMYMSNTTGSKAIYFLDTSVIEVRVLQDMTYEPLAKTNDSDKFMLKMYETLIIRSAAFCSWVGEIA